MTSIDNLKAKCEANTKVMLKARIERNTKLIERLADDPNNMEAHVNDMTTARMSGKTTRLVDMYIQHLFIFGWAHVRVAPNEESEWANKSLMDYVRSRIELEHSHYKFVVSNQHIFLEYLL